MINKIRFGLLIIILISLFFTLDSCSITQQEEDGISKTILPAEQQNVEIPEGQQALLVYYSGEVGRIINGEMEYIDVGETVNSNDVLSVGPDSFCELQFGNTAIVRIEENTIVQMLDIYLEANKSDVDMKVTLGTVLSKVNKLKGDDQFTVRTETAVCGVRGTEFGVSVNNKKDTKLSVREGGVAVLPASVDVKTVKKKAQNIDKSIYDRVVELEKKAPVVQENQEITISGEIKDKKVEALEKVASTIDKIEKQKEASGMSRVSAEQVTIALQEVNEAINTAELDLAEVIEAPKQLSITSTETLKKIEKMAFIKIPERKAGEPQTTATEAQSGEQVEEEPEVQLKKLIIQATPANARILINEKESGTGMFRGVFAVDQLLNITVSRDGFIDREFKVNMKDEGGSVITVSLKPALPKAREEQRQGKKDETQAEQEKGGSNQSDEADVPVDEPETQASDNERKETDDDGPDNGQQKAAAAQNSQARQKQADNAAEQKQDKIEDEPVRIGYTIETKPVSAGIVINGKNSGTGSVSAEAEEGTVLNIVAFAEGYEQKERQIQLTSKADNEYIIELEPQSVLDSFNISKGSIANRIVGHGNLIYVYDTKGILTALSKSGNIAWQYNSKNTQNEKSYPVIIGNTCYVSGAKEFAAVNAKSGKLVFSKPLKGFASHIFAQHITKAGSHGLFPAGSSIDVFNLATGEIIRKLNVPGGSTMSPTYHKGKVYIVNQKGLLLKIDFKSGEIESETKATAVQPVAMHPVVSGNSLFYAGRKGILVCIDLGSMDILWEVNIGVGNIFNEVVVAGNTVLVTTEDSLHGYNKSSGAQSFRPVKNVTSLPALKGGWMYVGSGKSLLRVHPNNGNVVKTLPTESVITARPLISGQRVYAGTNNGRILVINRNAFN